MSYAITPFASPHALNELQSVKKAFFYGVQGCGMLALAGWFIDQGVEVFGYDDQHQACSDLRIKMVPVPVLDDIDLVCVTTALKDHHPFFKYLQGYNGLFYKRPELLSLIINHYSSIGITGTHGKTTTTSLLSFVLDKMDIPHHGFIGGYRLDSNRYSTYHKDGKFLVFEADESTRDLVRYKPLIAVVLNANADHLEHFDFKKEQYQDNICEFALQAPYLVIERSTFEQLGLAKKNSLTQKIIIIEEDVINLPDGTSFALNEHDQHLPLCLRTPKSWQHRAAVLGVIAFIGGNLHEAAQSMCDYRGVGYRLEHLNAQHPFVWRDYGHHPHEILNVYLALKKAYPAEKKVIVFQPHKFSRTKLFFDDFVNVLSQFDEVYLLPTYAAGEAFDKTASAEALQRAIPGSILLDDRTPASWSFSLNHQTLVLFQGAGSIMSYALDWCKEH